MCVITDGSEKQIPVGSTIISDNSISIVWRGSDGYIYKRSIPFLIENEIGILKRIEHLGVTPKAERYDKYTIKMEDLGKSQTVTKKTKFARSFKTRLDMIHSFGIRHGDLTRYSVIVKDNEPFFIDFAESRYITDLRPEKREEGDTYWMERTINELTEGL